MPLAAADRNRAIEARPGSRRVPGAADRERPVQRQAVRGPAGLRRNKLTHKHTDGLCRACRVASVRSSRRRSAVAISAAEEPLGELRVRACAVQAERLLGWAAVGTGY